jgi:single-strand DNA-binding protein
VLNRVELIGRLGKDPELLEMGGKPMCRLRLATTYRHKTEWHDIVVWGARAEACARYLVKGRAVYVDGRIQARSWEGKDGQKHHATEIVASNVLFLHRPDSSGRDEGRAYTDEEIGIPPGEPDSLLIGDPDAPMPF